MQTFWKKITSKKTFFLFVLIFLINTNIQFIYANKFVNRVNVKTLAINKELVYKKIHNSKTLQFKPFILEDSPEDIFYKRIPETFILKIYNGKIFSNHGIIITKENNLVEELLWPWSNLKRIKDKKVCLDFKEERTYYTDTTIATVAQEGSHNYYHWMTEVLPRIVLLEKAKINYDYLYISENTPSCAVKTLQLFGVNLDKVRTCGEKDLIQAKKLIVPSFASFSCFSTKWIVSCLKKKILRKLSTLKDKYNFSKNIFISRKKALSRVMLNEDDLLEELKRYSFKRYFLEDLSVAEQVLLFNNAHCIVAAHGAGLTNIIFCESNVKIVEIFQKHNDDTFWLLGQTLDLKNYFCIKTVEFDNIDGRYSNTTINQNSIDEILQIVKI